MSDYHVYKKANFYVPSRYLIAEVLGRGSYGVVCKAYDTESTQRIHLAVKKILKVFTTEYLLRRAIRELKLMQFFRGHPNVCTTLVSPYSKT